MIIVRSPLRISLAGGGTDLPDYYADGAAGHYGAVCSLAINKYVYVTINNLSSYFPHRFRVAYSQTELVADAHSIKHPIVREAFLSHHIEGGLDLNVMADIPAGTGMGSSSTFTVSVLHALHAFNHQLTSKEQLAKEACELEIQRLKEPIGKQDQYAAAFGGINLFRFHQNENVEVSPLPLHGETDVQLRQRLLLFYLGGHRSASAILSSQKSNAKQNRESLDRMRSQALEAAEILSHARPTSTEDSSDLDALGSLLRRGWEHKRRLADGISNPTIEEAMDAGLKAGALGGKLLGAGGTGFLLFYVRPRDQAAVRRALEKLTEISYDIDRMGSTLLYYSP